MAKNKGDKSGSGGSKGNRADAERRPEDYLGVAMLLIVLILSMTSHGVTFQQYVLRTMLALGAAAVTGQVTQTSKFRFRRKQFRAAARLTSSLAVFLAVFYGIPQLAAEPADAASRAEPQERSSAPNPAGKTPQLRAKENG